MAENKTCKQCQKEFQITDTDLAFLDRISPTFAGQKFSIPVPTLCPACRQIRRLVLINYKSLYSRKCDKSGEPIVTCYAPNSPHKIWKNEYWWRDDWSATDYGRDFDFNRPFFEQLQELSLAVPRPHTHVLMNENSEFTNGVTAAKNSYMVLNATNVDNCYYGYRLTNCKDCIDCFSCDRTEKSYECIDANGCYYCFFSQDIENCAESILLRDCKGCKNCIGCSNLSNKQYWLYNKQSTKEEFDREWARIFSLSYDESQLFRERIEGDLDMAPKRYAHITKSEESTGDHISNCKNVLSSNHVAESQDIKYCFDMYQAKNSMDYDLWGAYSQWIYECAEVGEKATNVAFCDHSYNNVSNIYYSMGVFQNSKDCFGCVYLRQKQYCILNKQYTKEAYEQLVAKIIEHMQKTGEWGELFPPSLSSFAYNETIAPDYYPLGKEEAEKFGARWLEEDFSSNFSGEPYIPAAIASYKPENNPNFQENIDQALAGIIKCADSGRPFRLQAKELAFYIENGLQIPTVHPDVRYKRRVGKVNSLTLSDRQCDCSENNHGHVGRCEIRFQSTYSTDKPQKVYCEKCYQQTIA